MAENFVLSSEAHSLYIAEVLRGGVSLITRKHNYYLHYQSKNKNLVQFYYRRFHSYCQQGIKYYPPADSRHQGYYVFDTVSAPCFNPCSFNEALEQLDELALLGMALRGSLRSNTLAWYLYKCSYEEREKLSQTIFDRFNIVTTARKGEKRLYLSSRSISRFREIFFKYIDSPEGFVVPNEQTGIEYNPIKNKHITITPTLHSLLIGGKLGDGYFDRRDKHTSYELSHSILEKGYLMWQYQFFKPYCYRSPQTIKGRRAYLRRNGSYIQSKDSLRLRTIFCPELDYYHDLSLNKTIEQLDELSFLIWLLDDGYYNKSHHTLRLYGGSLNHEQMERAARILEEKLSLRAALCFYQGASCGYLNFGVQATRQIRELALKYFPEDLDIIQKKIVPI